MYVLPFSNSMLQHQCRFRGDILSPFLLQYVYTQTGTNVSNHPVAADSGI